MAFGCRNRRDIAAAPARLKPLDISDLNYKFDVNSAARLVLMFHEIASILNST